MGQAIQKIGTLSNGAKVEIVESKNGWYKIKYNGGYGYVSGDYIKIGGSTTNPPSTTKTGVVTATSLKCKKWLRIRLFKNRNIIKWSKSRNSRK
ncbi:SH3 domain-containing protein [Paraclostridium bifermentans]|nr:SH3 domain-containing protein [Paraclostridium bifermentans]